MVIIRNELPADHPAIEPLLDTAFEPSRHGRPSYRLREGVEKCDELCFVAEDGTRIVGVLRFWPIEIDGTAPLLLGPIAVHPDHEGRGIGSRLMQDGLEAARHAGYRVVIAIGAITFLGRFGFKKASPFGLRFPVPVDDARFLVLELTLGALDGVAGEIRPAFAKAARRSKRQAG